MVISFTILDEELAEFKEIIERGLPMKGMKHTILEAYLRRWIEREEDERR